MSKLATPKPASAINYDMSHVIDDATSTMHSICKPPAHMRMASPAPSTPASQPRRSASGTRPTGSSVPSSLSAPLGRT